MSTGCMPARRAPATSIAGMSPTYHACSASMPIASTASSKMRGSGFITPTAPESMTHSTSMPSPGPTCRISSVRRRSPMRPSAFEMIPRRTSVSARARSPSWQPGITRSQSAASANSLST